MSEQNNNTGSYGIDWKNVDLNSPYESSQSILDEYTFDQLLLEINCNLKVINEINVQDQFEEVLKERIREARIVFNNNRANIVKKALQDRNIDND